MKQSYIAPWSQLYSPTGKSLAMKQNVAMSFCQRPYWLCGKASYCPQ